MTDTITEAVTADAPEVTTPTLPSAQTPMIAIMETNPQRIGLLFPSPSEPSMKVFVFPNPGRERRLAHYTYVADEVNMWLAGLEVQSRWSDHTIRVVGTHPDPRRFLTEDDDWKWTAITSMVEAEMVDMRERLVEGLREAKSERDWCSELEEQWLPKMGIPRAEFRSGPTYRTYEVGVTVDVTSRISSTRTVTLEMEAGESDESMRDRARDQAAEDFTDDLHSSIDFGREGYYSGNIEYEVEDTDIEASWESDEDGSDIED